jgi:hypothetical protein
MTTKLSHTTIIAAIVFLFSAAVVYAWLPGRMTGGGSIFTTSGVRVTHGFELHCGSDSNPVPAGPNNLEINWDSGNHFHLDTVTLADCSRVDDISPAPPPNTADGFNTYHGIGTGTCNGVSGVAIDWIFTDQGEPGTKDTAQYSIAGGGACPTLNVGPTNLTFGNHQAHKE